MIRINEPIWKNRSVGLADYKLVDGDNRVEILYEDATGERVFPGFYKITGQKAKTYPIQLIKQSGVKVHIVPINEMDHVRY